MKTITTLFETIRRMFYWAFVMRSNHDWDYSYAEQVLLLKLKRLQHAMNTCPYHYSLEDLYKALKDSTIDEFERNCYIANIKAHRALNVVIELLERQQDTSFYGDFSGLYTFIETYRSDRPDALSEVLDRHKNKITIPDEEYRKRLLQLREIDARMEERDKRWAYSLIAKYGSSWWV